MQVAVQNTRADFNAFSEHVFHLRFGRTYWFVRRVQPVVSAIAGIAWLCLLEFYWSHVPLMPTWQKVDDVCTGLLLVATSQMWPFILANNYSVAQRKRKFGKPMKAQLYEDGLCIEQEGTETLLPWSSFRRIDHNDSYVFLVIDSHKGYVIPDSAFDSSIPAQQFVELANAYKQRFEPHPGAPPIADPV